MDSRTKSGVGPVEPGSSDEPGDLRRVDPVRAGGEHEQRTAPARRGRVGNGEHQRVRDLGDRDAELLGGCGGGAGMVTEDDDLTGRAGRPERGAHARDRGVVRDGGVTRGGGGGHGGRLLPAPDTPPGRRPALPAARRRPDARGRRQTGPAAAP